MTGGITMREMIKFKIVSLILNWYLASAYEARIARTRERITDPMLSTIEFTNHWSKFLPINTSKKLLKASALGKPNLLNTYSSWDFIAVISMKNTGYKETIVRIISKSCLPKKAK